MVVRAWIDLHTTTIKHHAHGIVNLFEHEQVISRHAPHDVVWVTHARGDRGVLVCLLIGASAIKTTAHGIVRHGSSVSFVCGRVFVHHK